MRAIKVFLQFRHQTHLIIKRVVVEGASNFL